MTHYTDDYDDYPYHINAPGVHFNDHSYVARITVDGKQRYLGSFFCTMTAYAAVAMAKELLAMEARDPGITDLTTGQHFTYTGPRKTWDPPMDVEALKGAAKISCGRHNWKDEYLAKGWRAAKLGGSEVLVSPPPPDPVSWPMRVWHAIRNTLRNLT